MISNMETLPAGLRRALFNSHWLTKTELVVITLIIEDSIKEHKVTKVKLGKLSGVSPSTIAKIFRNEYVGLNTILSIARVLDDDHREKIESITDSVGESHELTEYSGRRWKLELVQEEG